jgi:O-antigen/teichoic acid export membrane protein
MLVLLVMVQRVSLRSVVLAYISAAFVTSTFAVWRLRRMIYPGIRFDRTLVRRMLLFSLPLIPSSLIGYLSRNYLDAFFIARFLTTADLGIYGVAYLIAGTTMQLPLLAGSLLMPLFVTLQTAGRTRSIARVIREVLPLLTLVWTTACMVFATMASYLLPLIFGDQFRAGATLLWPLMLSAALAGPALMGYFPLLNAQGLTYIMTVNAGIAAAVNVGLDVLLIPRFGLSGSAWATAAAYLCGIGAISVMIRWHFSHFLTWTPLALLPAVVGAATALSTAIPIVPLATSLLTTGILICLQRKSIRRGMTTLKEAEVFQSLRAVVLRLSPKKALADHRPA